MRLAAVTRTSLALAALSATALAHSAAPVTPPTHARATASAPMPVPPAAPASAAAPLLSDACPAQLPVRQTVSETIPGWTPVNQQGSYPFVRVAFYPASPADTSLIVPTVEYRRQAGLRDGWDLPRRPGGYSMTCAYANTPATLSRKLADDVDFCQADYDGRFLTLVVKHWSCGAKRLMGPSVWARPAARPAARPPIKAPVRRVD